MPGLTNCDSRTAPVRPPPLPGVGPPLYGVLGPEGSVQQSSAPLSDSSKVTTSSPSFLNAGDPVIRGTQVWRNWSELTSPPGSFIPLQGSSWPSWQRSGVMKLKLGVVPSEARSAVSLSSGTTRCAQIGLSMIE